MRQSSKKRAFVYGLTAALAAGAAIAADPLILAIDVEPIPTAFGPAGEVLFAADRDLKVYDGTAVSILHDFLDPVIGMPAGFGASPLDPLRAEASGDLAFLAALRSGGGSTFEGAALIASDALGNLEILFREDDPVPSLPPPTRFGEHIFDLELAVGGNLVARVSLRETPSALPITTSVWYRSAFGPLTLLHKAGDTPAGFALPLTHAWPFMNHAGAIAIYARDSSGAYQIALADSLGNLTTLIREGDSDPAGLIGTQLQSICCGTPGRRFTWSNAGIAFAASLENGIGGVDFTNYKLLLASDGAGGLRVVARMGDPIPGRPEDLWGTLSDAVINDSGQIAFYNGYPNAVRELVLYDPAADPVVVAENGQQALGFPPGTQISNLGPDLSSPLVLNEDGAVSFTALVPPLTDAFGIFARAHFIRTAEGVLFPVAADGDVIEVKPGDFRTVVEVTGGAIDESGNMVLNLWELDALGYQDAMATALYDVPEPGGSVPIACATLGLFWADRVRRRRRGALQADEDMRRDEM